MYMTHICHICTYIYIYMTYAHSCIVAVGPVENGAVPCPLNIYIYIYICLYLYMTHICHTCRYIYLLYAHICIKAVGPVENGASSCRLSPEYINIDSYMYMTHMSYMYIYIYIYDICTHLHYGCGTCGEWSCRLSTSTFCLSISTAASFFSGLTLPLQSIWMCSMC